MAQVFPKRAWTGVLGALMIACAASPAAPANSEATVTSDACSSRQCGPHPVTHEDCGTCDSPGMLACNDGICEATCDAQRCAAMGYEFNTCSEDEDPCDGSGDSGGGSYGTWSFTCSPDGTTCDGESDAVGCGVTDCGDDANLDG